MRSVGDCMVGDENRAGWPSAGGGGSVQVPRSSSDDRKES